MGVVLAVIENITGACGAAEMIEALLPPAVRRRQLTARTLLTGMMLTLADGRPAHLTRVHQALMGTSGSLVPGGMPGAGDSSPVAAGG